ncbi:hypothetical protein MMC25_000966 [Agyrium rufum]|nr:hypothetical protein [Agyrium rufum]
MEKLPNEILHQIFEDVYFEEGRLGLKRLRAACKRFGPLAIPFIFNIISISDKARDLEAFNAWTSTLELVGAVKEVAYNIDPLLSDLTEEAYYMAVLVDVYHFYGRFGAEHTNDEALRDLLSYGRCSRRCDDCECDDNTYPKSRTIRPYIPGLALRNFEHRWKKLLHDAYRDGNAASRYNSLELPLCFPYLEEGDEGDRW